MIILYNIILSYFSKGHIRYKTWTLQDRTDIGVLSMAWKFRVCFLLEVVPVGCSFIFVYVITFSFF